jgi:glutathione S-transferase
MTKPKLTYFDAAVSRGEECRLALTLAGVDFEDVRIKPADWPALKPTTPFGSLPFFEVPGHGVFGQSNAILVLIGRRHGLHPNDDFEAARHEALMAHVEDLRAAIAPSQRMKDEAQRKQAREALAETYLPQWAKHAEEKLGAGPFVAGDKIHVADVKLYMALRWIARGTLDHIPATSFSRHTKLMRLHDAVANHPAVQAWNAKQKV